MSLLVSICIPSYGHPDLLHRCLQSITVQDYTNIEVIISDDTPDDRVKSVLAIFKNQINIRYYHNHPSLGTPLNWNAAIDKAYGDIIWLLHHDDWLFYNEVVSKCVQAFNKNPDKSFLFGRSVAIDKKFGEKALQQEYFMKYIHQPENLLLKNEIGPPSNLLFRSTVKERYKNPYKWLVDLEYYIRIFSSGHMFVYMDEPIIKVGIHDGQMTGFVNSNRKIILIENIMFAGQHLNRKYLTWKIFDHYWRLFRTYSTWQIAETLQEQEQTIDFLQVIAAWQRLIPKSVLKVGVISKVLMFACYLLNTRSS